MVDTKFEVILRILFLKISNADVLFGKKTLTWRTYTTNKVLSTTKRVQIVDPKEFVIVVLNVNSKTFVVHMPIRKQEKIPMHSEKQAQVRALLFDGAPTEVSAEYSDYSDVFSAENATELLENTGMNEYTIKLEEGK